MVDTQSSKKARRRRGNKTIGFAQETITKSVADKMLLAQKLQQVQAPQQNKEECGINTGKKQNKKRKQETVDNVNVSNIIAEQKENNTNPTNGKISKQKKKKTQEAVQLNEQEELVSSNQTEDSESNAGKSKKRKRKAEQVEPTTEIQDELDPRKPKINQEESIRARKRRKFAELVKGKKEAHELEMQQKCLNYLSQWKHSRTQWRFEKLKQIWLQGNLYDDSKIPDEFFQTAVDYFNSGKGKVRDVILKESLSILEKEDEAEKEKEDDAENDEEGNGKGEDEETEEKESNETEKLFSKVKYTRARNIVQLLNE